MSGLIAVSLGIALVTVVPGLITIAAVFGAFVFVDPEYTATVDVAANEWIWSAVAVTIMILTQVVGILATVGILLSVSIQGASLPVLIRGGLYIGLLLGALAISFPVAATRFSVMTLSMWAFRTNPTRERTSPSHAGQSVPEPGRRPVADEM